MVTVSGIGDTRAGLKGSTRRTCAARYRANSCSSSASTPGCRAAATAASSGRRAGSHAVAVGVLTTDPAAPLPARLADLQADLRALLDELTPAVVAVERVLFSANARTAIGVAPGGGDRHGRRRRARARGRRVLAQRGQARHLRLRLGRQGAGRAHGPHAAPHRPHAADPSTRPTRSRWRCATSRTSPFRRRAAAATAGVQR